MKFSVQPSNVVAGKKMSPHVVVELNDAKSVGKVTLSLAAHPGFMPGQGVPGNPGYIPAGQGVPGNPGFVAPQGTFTRGTPGTPGYVPAIPAQGIAGNPGNPGYIPAQGVLGNPDYIPAQGNAFTEQGVPGNYVEGNPFMGAPFEHVPGSGDSNFMPGQGVPGSGAPAGFTGQGVPLGHGLGAHGYGPTTLPASTPAIVPAQTLQMTPSNAPDYSPGAASETQHWAQGPASVITNIPPLPEAYVPAVPAKGKPGEHGYVPAVPAKGVQTGAPISPGSPGNPAQGIPGSPSAGFVQGQGFPAQGGPVGPGNPAQVGIPGYVQGQGFPAEGGPVGPSAGHPAGPGNPAGYVQGAQAQGTPGNPSVPNPGYVQNQGVPGVPGYVPAVLEQGVPGTPGYIAAVPAQGGPGYAQGQGVPSGSGNPAGNPGYIGGPELLGKLHGTMTKDAVKGKVTFDDLVIDKAGKGYKLVATVGGHSITSHAFDVK